MTNTNDIKTVENNTVEPVIKAEITTPVAELPLVAVVHDTYGDDINFLFLV